MESISSMLKEKDWTIFRPQGGRKYIVVTVSWMHNVWKFCWTGANVEAYLPQEGITPIMGATYFGKLDTLNILLDAGGVLVSTCMHCLTPIFFGVMPITVAKIPWKDHPDSVAFWLWV